MSPVWMLQDAKNAFSEVVNRACSSGPQIVTRRGRPVAVVISYENYSEQKSRGESFVDFLGRAQLEDGDVDTLLICTGTAFMILCSGTYNIFDARTGEMLVAKAPELGANYVGFTQAAVDSVMQGFGGAFVSVALLFFVFTTIMAYYFYGESSIMYMFRGRKGEKAVVWVFRFALLGMLVFGAVKEAGVIWQIGDIGVGITAWINVIALLILCPQAIRALKEFEKDA